MITVGLVKELKFIATVINAPVVIHFNARSATATIGLKITKDRLKISYLNDIIWDESLEEATSMFGIESCDNIMKIIKKIDSNDGGWRELAYFEPKESS